MQSTMRAPIGRRAVLAITGLLAAVLAALSLAQAASAYPVGFNQIRPAHVNGMCLDVANISMAHGADVIQGRCWNGWNQQWKLEPAGDGWYFIHPRHAPGMCLDVYGGFRAHGTDVIQGSCWGGSNQQWGFTLPNDRSRLVDPQGGIRYRLIARHSNRCLDVANQSLAHAANVLQGTCWDPGYNQQWTLVPTS